MHYTSTRVQHAYTRRIRAYMYAAYTRRIRFLLARVYATTYARMLCGFAYTRVYARKQKAYTRRMLCGFAYTHVSKKRIRGVHVRAYTPRIRMLHSGGGIINKHSRTNFTYQLASFVRF